MYRGLLLLLFILFSIEGFSQHYEVKIDSGKYIDYTIIEDLLTLNEFADKIGFKYSEKINFDEEFLIYNSIWTDCNGSYKITTEYDSLTNILTLKIYKKYGGSRGMCPQDCYTKIKKHNPGMKIIFKEIKLK
ncbi:MAG: hypothetical protein HUU47_03445 [Bacteroidetes bacterium]|nr:hypothetical protein [Bacteroidota bacterium]